MEAVINLVWKSDPHYLIYIGALSDGDRKTFNYSCVREKVYEPGDISDKNGRIVWTMNKSVREGDAPPFSKTSFNLYRGLTQHKYSTCVESEKQNSDECANLQYVNIFVENQPVTALIDSGCQIPVLNSSLIRVQTPSEEIITLSSCFGEKRMVEVKPINISLDQHSPGISVRTAISPTLTEEFIIHPSVYSEIEKLGHAKNDVLLSESESSLSADYGVSFPNVSVSNVIENSSYDFQLCHENEFRGIHLRSPTPSPMERNYRRFVLLEGSLSLGQWKRRKKRNRFEQTSRTLQRKISMRSTKDQLVKKDVLMPVKQCFPVEPSGCRRGAFT
ncbi:hypothetical protein TNCV_3815551 [Trichonephila clavipes]|nr:hypothetical protein TNCV_3815551 [Trichonephila clavipes]